MKEPVSVGRAVLASVIAGWVGAVLANVTAIILSRQMGQNFEQLNWFSISRASMISCVLAGFVYSALARWTRRPAVWFAALGLGVAAGDSVMVALHPPEAGFDRIANPLHFVVAISALVLIPALAPAFPQPNTGRAMPPPVPEKA